VLLGHQLRLVLLLESLLLLAPQTMGPAGAGQRTASDLCTLSQPACACQTCQVHTAEWKPRLLPAHQHWADLLQSWQKIAAAVAAACARQSVRFGQGTVCQIPAPARCYSAQAGTQASLVADLLLLLLLPGLSQVPAPAPAGPGPPALSLRLQQQQDYPLILLLLHCPAGNWVLYQKLLLLLPAVVQVHQHQERHHPERQQLPLVLDLSAAPS
jgi:hypothetical protein